MVSRIQVKQIRRYDIDWLRNFVIFLLIPFHTARIFDYWEPNYVKSASLSWSLSWFIVLIGYWFMPLMFWLAGASSWYALDYRTGIEYVKERISRLFVPLVFGIILIVPPQGYLARLSNPSYHEGYLQFLSSYFRDFSDLSGYFGTFTPAHLWFILYLFIFSLLGLPIFLALTTEHGKHLLVRIALFLSNPWVYISLFIFLTATEALPAPDGKNPFFFFFLYLAGYITSADERFSTVTDSLKHKALIFLVPYLPIYIVLTSKWAGLPDFSSESILLAFIRNLALWLTLIVVLGYGKKYLSIGGRWLNYINQAAFPIYIIHQTILLIIGFLVLRIGLGVGWEYLLIMISSFLICIGIYELIIRRIAVTRWLFGVKVKTSFKKTNGTLEM